MDKEKIIDLIQETRDKMLQLSIQQHELGSMLAQQVTGVKRGNLIVMSRNRQLISGAAIRVAWVHNIFIEGVEHMIDFKDETIRNNVVMEVRVMNKSGQYSNNITRITIGDFLDVSDNGIHQDPIGGMFDGMRLIRSRRFN